MDKIVTLVYRISSKPKNMNPMQPDKNLQASVPPALLSKIEQAARDENITIDEFVANTMERRVNRSEFEEMLAFGKRHARERGLKPSDVEKTIAEVRAGKERGR